MRNPRWSIWVLAICLGGCAGDEPEAETTTAAPAASVGAEAPAEPPPPQLEVPDDPLAFLRADCKGVVRADLEAIRSSPLSEPLRQRLAEETGFSMQEHPWLEATRSALLCLTDLHVRAAEATGIVVLQGRYEVEDVRQIVETVTKTLHGKAPPSRVRLQRNVEVRGNAHLLAVLPEPGTLVLATPERMDHVLDVLLGQSPPTIRSSKLFERLGAPVQIEEAALGIMLEPSPRLAEDLLGRARGLGSSAKQLINVLAASRLGLRAKPDTGLEAALFADTPSEADAKLVVSQARELLWKAALIFRLAGLPPVLDRALVRADGKRANAALRVNRSELSAILARFDRIVKDPPQPRPQP